MIDAIVGACLCLVSVLCGFYLGRLGTDEKLEMPLPSQECGVFGASKLDVMMAAAEMDEDDEE